MYSIENRLNLSDNAIKVLERRYLIKDNTGKVIETPEQLFEGVSYAIAETEALYNEGRKNVPIYGEIFYELMTEGKFLPNSPTLMNAGKELGQLAACFVLPVPDSMEGIFDSLKYAALIHKSGGGTGFSFSKLRPKNSRVGSTGGVASGPVSFMKIYNTATEQVKQGGTRRGANMGILRVDHPDIEEFIDCKQYGDLQNFNLSVGITDEFMSAVEEGRKYDLIDPHDKSVTGQSDAREIYEKLVNRAWYNGDPGVVFLDKMNKDNPTPQVGDIEATNPCGEQPLLPMEACNLGSINLAKFVIQTNDGMAIDYENLGKTTLDSTRFLDNTIDASKYPLPEIDEMVKGNRKIGLGVMGFADMLYQLNVPYNSEEALKIAEDVMGFVQEKSKEASIELAKERDMFSNLEKSVFNGDENRQYRNATTTTIAPTGTLSILANCSSGIEPLFALSFVRNVMDNDELLEVNPYFEKVAKERGFYSEELMEKIAEEGSVVNIDEVPEDVKKVFVTAHDINPEWHIKMQAAFQKHVDNAVSKTVNLPNEATPEDIKKIYDLAYDLGCKGVTVYRDGSRKNQVLSTGKKKEGGLVEKVLKRPETLEGFTTKMETGYGTLYVTVSEYEGKPFEVFATIGKSGNSTTAKTEAIGRLTSLALRLGSSVEKIVDQLEGIGGEKPTFRKGGMVLSIPDAIAKVLKKRYDNGPKKIDNSKGSLNEDVCPDCGAPLKYEEGCVSCSIDCGFTKCG